MRGAVLIVFMSIILIFTIGTAYSGDVEKGKTLFNNTSLGTNGKSCNSCHPGGRGIDGSKESFEILGEKLTGMVEAVNFCIENALDGKALEGTSEDMKDIVSYIKTLKGKKEVESVTPGY